MISDISSAVSDDMGRPRRTMSAHIAGPWFHMAPAMVMRLPLISLPRRFARFGSPCRVTE